MLETETAATALGFIDQIAAALGCPTSAIQLVIVSFLIIALLAGIFALLAVFRIRKELISLNFKIIYIGRLIEQAVKKPETPKEPKAPPKMEATEKDPAESTDSDIKWKL